MCRRCAPSTRNVSTNEQMCRRFPQCVGCFVWEIYCSKSICTCWIIYNCFLTTRCILIQVHVCHGQVYGWQVQLNGRRLSCLGQLSERQVHLFWGTTRLITG